MERKSGLVVVVLVVLMVAVDSFIFPSGDLFFFNYFFMKRKREKELVKLIF